MRSVQSPLCANAFSTARRGYERPEKEYREKGTVTFLSRTAIVGIAASSRPRGSREELFPELFSTSHRRTGSQDSIPELGTIGNAVNT